jgi:circadian clock protein KaiC
MTSRARASEPQAKAASGIVGFDHITGGGLLRGRATVVLGVPGSGKTIFGLQVLAAGARQGEPGIFVAFEEAPGQILEDASSISFDLAALSGKGVHFIDARLSEVVLDGGEFDLLGLLAGVGALVKQTGAQRIVFDGIDQLVSHLGSPALIRRELLRLRAWALELGLTCIVTSKAQPSDGQSAAEYEFLEFAADSVIVLQHPLSEGAAVRTLRVAKYRGDAHSANEFPFTITEDGIEMAAGTAAQLSHPAFTDRVSSGVERLDAMLGGGYYRGSSVLISGAPGTSKTSLAASFAAASCKRGDRTVFVSFDEAPEQIIRNVASIGIDLAREVQSGLLEMCSLRARSDNPEAHVARIRALLKRSGARSLVVDPLSAIARTADSYVAGRAAVQLLDIAKALGVTMVSTSLLASAAPNDEATQMGVSTIADTWMHVSYASMGGERNRALTIVKSRGTKHSNQVRELILTEAGVTVADAYLSRGEVLMGTMRWERENEDRRADALALITADMEEKQAQSALAEVRARAEAVHAELLAREAELKRVVAVRQGGTQLDRAERAELLDRRGGDSSEPAHHPDQTETR